MYSHEHGAKVRRFSPSHNISAPLFIHFVNIFDVNEASQTRYADAPAVTIHRQDACRNPTKTSSHRDL